MKPVERMRTSREIDAFIKNLSFINLHGIRNGDHPRDFLTCLHKISDNAERLKKYVEKKERQWMKQ